MNGPIMHLIQVRPTPLAISISSYDKGSTPEPSRTHPPINQEKAVEKLDSPVRPRLIRPKRYKNERI